MIASTILFVIEDLVLFKKIIGDFFKYQMKSSLEKFVCFKYNC